MFSFATVLLGSILGREQPQTQPDPLSSIIGPTPPLSYKPPFHDYNVRTELKSSPYKTTAYPSIGGIVLAYLTAVELDYLGLSRFNPETRSTNEAEEDDLALRMLGLGAQWWSSWRVYAYHDEGVRTRGPYDFHYPPYVNVAYPSSGKGVWVFKFSAETLSWDGDKWRKPYIDEKPEDWKGRIHSAFTMDERCEVLKNFGAKFYENSEDCPDIPRTLQDACERGKGYEELLSRFTDPRYANEWYDHL